MEPNIKKEKKPRIKSDMEEIFETLEEIINDYYDECFIVKKLKVIIETPFKGFFENLLF